VGGRSDGVGHIGGGGGTGLRDQHGA
jgi:hypothetical protein